MQPKDFEEEMLVMERRMKERDRRRKKVEDDNAKTLEDLPFSPMVKKILAKGEHVKSPVCRYCVLLSLLFKMCLS